jgi:hypothetical protein
MAHNSIPYQVECRDVIGGFEVIAAFDCDVAAFSYMRSCAKNKLAGARYRVTYRGKTLREVA